LFIANTNAKIAYINGNDNHTYSFYFQTIQYSRGADFISVKDQINKAVKAFADGNNEEGVTILEQVLSDVPGNVDAWVNLGTYYLESKQTEKAIECYLKAAELEPLNGTIWHYFSLAYCDVKQYNKAVSASITALALEPQNQKIWLNHGYILEQGDLPRDYLAFEKIKKAINVKRKELGLPQVNIT